MTTRKHTSKPVEPGKTRDEDIADRKAAYLGYFRVVPIQRLAAGFVGRDEDTIINWRKADPTFAEDVSKAESEWAMEKVQKVDEKFLLERILRTDFAPPKQEIENTNPTVVNITYEQPRDRLQAVSQTGSGVAVPDQSNDD